MLFYERDVFNFFDVVNYDDIYCNIFFLYIYRNVIERRKIDSWKREIVVKYNIYVCKGIAVDWLNKNLYWTDEDTGTISIVSLKDFSKRRTLIRDKKSKPQYIVLNLETG